MTKTTLRRRWWGGVLIGLISLAWGCGGGGSSTPPAALSGTLHGGLSPISGATVDLYETGSSGFRSGAVLLGTATSDASGNFTVSYHAPVSPAVLYVIALGGNAGSGVNSAIGLAGIAGLSSALPATVTVNELSTVAAEFALAQFFDATGANAGTTATNAIGLINAVDLAQTNLVNISSGAVAAFWPAGSQCSAASPPANCEGLERLNTLANILAACVASSGPSSSACSQLLGAAGKTSNTLAAAHFIATNPGVNAATLFGLAQGSQAYSPVLADAPDAWTLALQYVGNGMEFDGPGNVAFDQFGNAWIDNNYIFNSDATQPTCGSDLLSELTPTGSDAPGAPFTGGGLNGGGWGVAIDLKNNVWVANFGFAGNGCMTPPPADSVSQFTAAGKALSPDGTGFTQGSVHGPQGIAVDQQDNVWIANFYGNSVTEYPGGNPDLAVNLTNGGYTNPFSVAVDAAGHIWISNFGAASLTELASNGTPMPGSPFTGGGLQRPLGVAIDSQGNVWVSDSLANAVTMFNSSGVPSPQAPFQGGGIGLPWGIAVDGNDNVWVANFLGIGENISELCGARVSNCLPNSQVGTPISPPSGYTSSLLTRLTGIQIDSSGNVWTMDNWKPIPIQTNPGGYAVVEFVGLAGPVHTPMLGPPRQP